MTSVPPPNSGGPRQNPQIPSSNNDLSGKQQSPAPVPEERSDPNHALTNPPGTARAQKIFQSMLSPDQEVAMYLKSAMSTLLAEDIASFLDPRVPDEAFNLAQQLDKSKGRELNRAIHEANELVEEQLGALLEVLNDDMFETPTKLSLSDAQKDEMYKLVEQKGAEFYVDHKSDKADLEQSSRLPNNSSEFQKLNVIFNAQSLENVVRAWREFKEGAQKIVDQGKL